MYVTEDYSEVILQRKEGFSDGILSDRVMVDKLVDCRLIKFFNELNGDSCLERNWRGLAGKLVKPPLTNIEVDILADSGDPARRLLTTWVSQSDGEKTFDILIATMLECKVYSACDELLNFLEDCEQESYNKEQEKLLQCVVANSGEETSKIENNPSQIVVREQRQQRAAEYRRSQSWPACPASWFSRLFRRRRPFRRRPFRRSTSCPDPIEIDSITPAPVEDEIFVVSSNTDSQGKAMRDLMSFMSRLKPVSKGSLTLKTIHDVDQNGKMTTSWLEERVNRARFVVLCFSSILKAIVDHKPGMPQFENQMEYNLKFTMDFLVTGRIYDNICRNPKGKYIPLLLPGNDYSTLIVPLKYFMSFQWPSEEKKISNYILGTPEYAVPQIPSPKPLIRKEFC